MSSNPEICKARTLFITRGVLNREIIPTDIIYSWVRSKLHNISFELLEIKAQEKPFDILTLDTEGSGIIKYLRTVKFEGSIIYLTAYDGTVIFMTDVDTLDLPIFTSLSEENIGSNAGGISVITRKATTVSGCEHYNKVLINYVSSSVVIESEHGSECYIITIFTPNRLMTSHNRLNCLVQEKFNKKNKEMTVVTVENEMKKEDVNPTKSDLNSTNETVGDTITNMGSTNGCKVFTLAVVEKKTIVDALEYYHWNLRKSAMALGIGRSTLYRKLKVYDIKMQ